MARPRRPASERDAVRALALPKFSARCNAARIARAVVSAYLADLAREDPLERAMFDAVQALEPDPLHALATALDSPASEQFRRERVKRYEARGCRQLAMAEWQNESAAIAKRVAVTLARRYRDYLK